MIDMGGHVPREQPTQDPIGKSLVVEEFLDAVQALVVPRVLVDVSVPNVPPVGSLMQCQFRST
jgi:hypothetical protein